MPPLCTHYKVDHGDDYNSDSKDDEMKDKDRAAMKPLKMTQGLL